MDHYFRKAISTGLVSVLCALSVTACGQTAGDAVTDKDTGILSIAEKTDTADTAKSSESEASPAEDAADSSESENARTGALPLVGVVTSEGGIEDGSFNQSAWDGLERLSGAGTCETKFLETTNGDFAGNLNNLVNAGGSLCWGIGYSCADAIREAANSNPDRSFAVIDYAFDDTPSNVTGVTFRAEEPSFLVGYIAACTTKTGKIGFVGGEDADVIHAFEYGFRAGVDYGAKARERILTVESVYAGTFTDQAKGKELANSLYQNGCDIIYHAAGETGIGVIDAARENNLYVIGVDKDQSYLAPDHVLSSALKYASSAIYRVSQSWIDGEAIGGTNVSLGLAEDAVGVSEIHGLYSDSIYDEMLALKDDIIAGRITPPADKTAYEQFSQTLK